jgi:hypothetical protein
VSAVRPEGLGRRGFSCRERRIQFAPTEGTEAHVSARIKHARYVCLELLDLGIRDLSWLHEGQKHQPELHPSAKELASFAMHVHVNLVEKVFKQEHIREW